MSASTGGTRRRGRHAWAVAGLIAVASVLAGCSSSADSGTDASYYAGEDAAYDEGVEAERYAVEEDAASGAAVTDSSTTVSERDYIVTGWMYMTVEDPIASADEVVSLVEGAGGRIDGRNETAPDEYSGGAASLTLRIPAAAIDTVLDKVRELGTVDELSTESYDVTTQVTDLEARISTLRASTERIEALLTQAEDIEDIITLEDELASRQAELESLEAQQRGLADQVSLSTIYLSLTTEPVVIIEEDSPDSFWDGVVAGWEGLMAFVSVALVVIGVLLPWLIVLGVIGLVVLLVVRSLRRRKAAAAPAEASAASSSPQAPNQD